MNNAKNTTLFPYLERLLEGEEVEWKTLGEVAEIGTGNSNRQDEAEDGLYPFYVRSKIYCVLPLTNLTKPLSSFREKVGLVIFFTMQKGNMPFTKGLIA